MTKEQAMKRAHEIVGETDKTAAVYVRLDKNKVPKDWCAGSAFDASPKAYRLAFFVSVTGLEREVLGGGMKNRNGGARA